MLMNLLDQLLQCLGPGVSFLTKTYAYSKQLFQITIISKLIFPKVPF